MVILVTLLLAWIYALSIEYLKPHCKRIDIATNGSLRTQKYFKNLANILKGVDHRVTFALDGLEDTHSYYRINTNFNKVIKMLKHLLTQVVMQDGSLLFSIIINIKLTLLKKCLKN